MNTMPLFTITNCDNGFIVEVHKKQSSLPFDMNEFVSTIQNAMGGRDEVLQQLQKTYKEEFSIKEQKEKNVHVFKTWSEVLAFLKFIME